MNHLRHQELLDRYYANKDIKSAAFAGNLTKLYTETKKSAQDNITVPKDDQGSTIPGLAEQHESFYKQKDRLTEWGLEWSDEGKGLDGNIDQSVAAAGLTETVTSVLKRIQEVLGQAERIKSASTPHKASPWALSTVEKGGWQPVDLPKYRNLVADLTTSIDILYDLTNNRRALAAGSHPSFGHRSEKAALQRALSSSDLRGQTAHRHQLSRRPPSRLYVVPQQIDLAALVLPDENPPPYQNAGVPLTTRLIGRLLRSQAPEDIRLALQESLDDPLVLVEYSNFDHIYRESRVLPPLQRLERLAEYLRDAQIYGQLSILGYFEDPQTARMGLVYDISEYWTSNFPDSNPDSGPIQVSSLLSLLQSASKTAKTHETLSATPPLEQRFRLAQRLARQVRDMHADNFVHGNINSDSIAFLTTGDESNDPQCNVRLPVLDSFDVFSKYQISEQPEDATANIYRHPEDTSTEFDQAAGLRFDMYGLGLLLLEIGLWTPLQDLHKAKYQARDFKTRLERIWIPRLAGKCGSAYMSAVQTCLQVSDGHLEMSNANHQLLADKLSRCCMLFDDGTADTAVNDVRGPLPYVGRTGTAAHSPNAALHHQADSTRNRKLQAVPRKELRRASSPAKPSHETLKRPQLDTLPRVTSSPAQMSLSESRSAMQSVSRGSGMGPIKEDFASAAFDLFSFREYRRRVVIIQKEWRRYAARKSSLQGRNLSPDDVHLAPLSVPDTIDTADAKSAQEIQTEIVARPKHRMFPVRLTQQQITEWQSHLGLKISRIVERALKNSLEPTTIDLVGVGADESSAKPTIIVTCINTAKVKAAIKKRFSCETSVFNIKVRKGAVALSCRGGKAHHDEAYHSHGRRANAWGSERY